MYKKLCVIIIALYNSLSGVSNYTELLSKVIAENDSNSIVILTPDITESQQQQVDGNLGCGQNIVSNIFYINSPDNENIYKNIVNYYSKLNHGEIICGNNWIVSSAVREQVRKAVITLDQSVTHDRNFWFFAPKGSLNSLNFLTPKKIHRTQVLDVANGLAFPWFTRTFLEIMNKWDMHDWDIFEWGCGHGTVWLSQRCKSLVSVDNNLNWIQSIEYYLKRLNMNNVVIKPRRCLPNSWDPVRATPLLNTGGREVEIVSAIDEDSKLYDCIIIDGNCSRNGCAEAALAHIKPGGIIIVDNVNQKSIGIDSTPTLKLLAKYEHHSYSVTDEIIGAPHFWSTDYWVIKK